MKQSLCLSLGNMKNSVTGQRKGENSRIGLRVFLLTARTGKILLYVQIIIVIINMWT